MANLAELGLNNVEADTGEYKIVPAGMYKAKLTDSKYAAMKTGNGKLIELTFSIIEGEYEGFKLTDRLSVGHKEERTSNIAKRQLKAFIEAYGMPEGSIQDTQQLHGLPIVIEVQAEDGKDKNGKPAVFNRIDFRHTKNAATWQPKQNAGGDVGKGWLE